MTLTPAPLPWREREKGRGGFFNAECGVKGLLMVAAGFSLRFDDRTGLTSYMQGRPG